MLAVNPYLFTDKNIVTSYRCHSVNVSKATPNTK